MRLLIIMAVAVCALCVRFNQCIQLMRPGSDGMPVLTQPAITPAELKAAHAENVKINWLPVQPQLFGPMVARDEVDGTAGFTNSNIPAGRC